MSEKINATEIRMSPQEERDIDRLVDTGVANYSTARALVLGGEVLQLDDEIDRPQEEAPTNRAQNGKKLPRSRWDLPPHLKASADLLPSRDDLIAQGMVPNDSESKPITSKMIEQARNTLDRVRQKSEKS